MVCLVTLAPIIKLLKSIRTIAMFIWAFEEGYFRPHYVTLEKGA
ncbi:hypothetical protein INT80_10110 [Gallibacterium anatis]|uniref:Uncharacterized protein n=1 Tax=Gallibacterium anatis TaxID=750 RepID=A0A930Y592_9PAST|nr:hypothetical protein [Gallibacterium anatis]